ncbi:hypothetical protein GGS24DRAFT_190655 [Hypoxylon argillaceum]|nr:hypothetical protein GGS24DRAFT_190655 [Hypoxylon argillaceum]
MSLTDAARRLLRTLSLSPLSSTAMVVDLQRDGRGGPAIRCAVDAADSSTTTTSLELELELWPSPSSISRRPASSSSSSSCASADQHDDQYFPPTIGEKNWDTGVRLRLAASSSHPYILGSAKAIPAPAIRRTDSFDSLASGSSTSSFGSNRASHQNVGVRSRRSDSASIGAWGEESARSRQPTARHIPKRSVRAGSRNEADEILWRGYWD